ncbi:glutamine-hydrolyzing GMP synthase [Luteolibacter pohnpeiensis]|uniref:GMP synthase (glutamine-hydrolyzing) n=1 Tax=Luteolibacter pohnpeiensis TaxID=454153 RepID=A0A934S8R5_9BACT|nr:glutamine-hydrolyzing GMP synthase [Luteolibacter pohnpeiensis]MBK1883425.1 glutamine-hydrolyzing GMP synthase [Luteolibacter pohnpeiensis]
MQDQQHVAVLDFGSQYTQLIVRRVRELGFFAKLYAIEEFPDIGQPGAIILSGGPKSTSEPDAPDLDFDALMGFNVPVLGVCYGMQLLNIKFGGSVEASDRREYGPANLVLDEACPLYEGISKSSQVWMSHSDTVKVIPAETKVIARNQHGTPVSLQWKEGVFGIQFHPEVTHSHEGLRILQNFLLQAKELQRFRIDDFKREIIADIKEKVGTKQVVCGVSGGVDSTVLAVLLKEAGANVRAIFVDHGLMRKNEGDEVRANFERMGVPIETVDCSERFLTALSGVDDPEKKRVIIGNLFIDVFWDAVGDAELLAQGTLYPDVIESASNAKSKASKIKTHHNRVDRILELQAEGKVLEPLAELFKDEVRELGTALGIPHDILQRHPFPGPGLAVRCPGEVTEQKLKIIRDCDYIFINQLKEQGWYDKVWQSYACLVPVKTVGVKGDERSYEWAISLRAVISEDAMTADWVELPYSLLREASNRILNDVSGINRVLYDISTKPPASIEWE